MGFETVCVCDSTKYLATQKCCCAGRGDAWRQGASAVQSRCRGSFSSPCCCSARGWGSKSAAATAARRRAVAGLLAAGEAAGREWRGCGEASAAYRAGKCAQQHPVLFRHNSEYAAWQSSECVRRQVPFSSLCKLHQLQPLLQLAVAACLVKEWPLVLHRHSCSSHQHCLSKHPNTPPAPLRVTHLGLCCSLHCSLHCINNHLAVCACLLIHAAGEPWILCLLCLLTCRESPKPSPGRTPPAHLFAKSFCFVFNLHFTST
jgi:hypothetical protein